MTLSHEEQSCIIGMPPVIGIDPGKSGACVALYRDGSFCAALDMPVAGTGSKARVQAWGIRQWINRVYPKPASYAPLSDLAVVIEKVHAMPQQGVTSTFSFGHATGCVYGLASALGCRIVEVAPREWQKTALHGKPRGSRKELKASAVQAAYERWPELREHLTMRGGKIRNESGFADAALMALHHIEKENR